MNGAAVARGGSAGCDCSRPKTWGRPQIYGDGGSNGRVDDFSITARSSSKYVGDGSRVLSFSGFYQSWSALLDRPTFNSDDLLVSLYLAINS